jgi:hypothetical protein
LFHLRKLLTKKPLCDFATNGTLERAETTELRASMDLNASLERRIQQMELFEEVLGSVTMESKAVETVFAEILTLSHPFFENLLLGNP